MESFTVRANSFPDLLNQIAYHKSRVHPVMDNIISNFAAAHITAKADMQRIAPDMAVPEEDEQANHSY
jgi:hypothetical protein